MDNLTYNLHFRESILLEKKSQIKLDLVKTSLLAVHIDGNEKDLQNLKSLLENSLPSFAALDVIIFSQDETQNEEKMILLFSDLINTNKVGKISLRTIPIPDLSKEALQVAPRLTRR